MTRFIRRYCRTPEGATAIEYTLCAAGISLAIMAVVFTFGDTLKDVFSTLPAAMSAASASLQR